MVDQIGLQNCPNCGATNAQNAVICVSCGVHIANYRAAIPHIEQVWEEYNDVNRGQLAETAEIMLTQELMAGRARTQKLLFLVFSISCVIGLLIISLSALSAYQHHQEIQRLTKIYEAALACLEQEDFMCARDKFLEIQSKKPNFKNTRQCLSDAYYGLALVYFDNENWSGAHEQLEAVLDISPNDNDTLQLLDQVYGKQIESALSKGNFLEALRLRTEKLIIFLH